MDTTIIHNRNELCEKIFEEPESATDERLSRLLYKSTACGASLTTGENEVCVNTIVEGSDAEFNRTLNYPFSTEEWDNAISEIESLAEEACKEANEGNDDLVFDTNGFEICVGDTVIWTDPDGGEQTTHQVTDKNGEIVILDNGTEVLGDECEVVH